MLKCSGRKGQCLPCNQQFTSQKKIASLHSAPLLKPQYLKIASNSGMNRECIHKSLKEQGDATFKGIQGSKRAKASGADFKPFSPLPPTPSAIYFLTSFTLISKMIKFDLSGADFSPRAEKLEP